MHVWTCIFVAFSLEGNNYYITFALQLILFFITNHTIHIFFTVSVSCFAVYDQGLYDLNEWFK